MGGEEIIPITWDAESQMVSIVGISWPVDRNNHLEWDLLNLCFHGELP